MGGDGTTYCHSEENILSPVSSVAPLLPETLLQFAFVIQLIRNKYCISQELSLFTVREGGLIILLDMAQLLEEITSFTIE